jgi:probable rRNA maturation factor
MHTVPGPQADPDPAASISVEVSDTQSHLAIDRQAVSRLVVVTLRAEGVVSASISIAIVDDMTIQALNRKHLAHDWPTDVIGFPLSEPGDSELSAELVVSAEMARKTAGGYGGNAWDELALYIVHGLLHFLGHDDDEPGPRLRMRKREAELLSMLGLKNPFEAGLGEGQGQARRSASWAS